jgi:hypothetical protein
VTEFVSSVSEPTLPVELVKVLCARCNRLVGVVLDHPDGPYLAAFQPAGHDRLAHLHQLTDDPPTWCRRDKESTVSLEELRASVPQARRRGKPVTIVTAAQR